MNIAKLSAKIIGGLLALILLLIIAGSIIIMIYVDKPFVEDQMKKALNRHVTIESINISIFSVISGIEVNDVGISNFKTPAQLEALKDKPVPENDLFAGFKAFRFNAELMPLMRREIVLTELMLYEPVINIIQTREGYFNFSDLIVPSEEDADPVPPSQTPAEPVSVDDIPVAISVGSIGMQDGTITFTDRRFNQTVQLYGVTAKVTGIEIDPENLERQNTMNIEFALGAKSIGRIRTGSVNSFDIKISANGKVIPFDLKSRELDPEISLKAGSPEGSVTGLQIFDSLDTIEQISRYSGKFEFLKDTVTWEDAYTGLWYKSDLVKLEGGRMKTGDFTLAFKGSHNTASKAIDMDLNMTVADKHKQSIQKGIQRNVERVVPSDALRVVSSDKITSEAMKPLLNEKEQVYLVYKITGTTTRPSTRLVAPKLPTLQEVAREAGADLKDMAAERAAKAAEEKRKEAEEEARKKAEKEADKLKDSAKDKVKSLF